ncbi:trigger factor [Clostridia bacterium]|nr:trigger factor [Clostridia bacterium]
MPDKLVPTDFTIEIDKHTLEHGLHHAYEENKNKFNAPGFRKGKVPRAMAEKLYAETLLEEALDHLFGEVYDDAVAERGIEPISRPSATIKRTETGAIISVSVIAKPEFTISGFDGLTYKKQEVSVTDDEVDAVINEARDKSAREITIADRPAKLGDIAVIDFKGYHNGVAFDGGESKDFSLELGSKSFIDTFEEQLVGLNAGESKRVDVTFPTPYNNKELEGQPAYFDVTLKSLKEKEVPALDEDFVKDTTEFSTVDEYKNDVREKLLKQKQENAETAKETEVLEALSARLNEEVPEIMINNEAMSMLSDLASRLRQSGMELDQYLAAYYGLTREQAFESNKPQAKRNVLARLALEAVVKLENITAEEDEIEKEIALAAERYQMGVEEFKDAVPARELDSLTKDIKVQKALKLVVDGATEITATE